MAAAVADGIVTGMHPTDEARRTDRLILALFLATAFLAAGALGAVQPALGLPAEVLQLTQFGPALGVLLALLVRPARTRHLLTGTLPRRGGTRHAALLLLTAPLIIAATAGTYAALTGDTRFTLPGHSLALIAAAQLIGACAEEIGWRCLLQPLLRTRYGVLAASLLVGAVWGVWHIQIFTEHPLYAAGFLLAALSMSVVLGQAQDGRTGRLPLAGGFHALINLGMLLCVDQESGAVLPMVLFGAACLATAVAWTRTSARPAGPASASPRPAPCRPDANTARLVALGMTLDRATRLLDTDPATARDLLLDVRRASEGALQDLRDLVHGIHPPVLADRGLGDAVRALALDSFLDVRVEARLPGRLPSPVEAAAYFAVGEALTNAAKHSVAQHIHIAIGHRDGTLRVTVTDDGHGGADPSAARSRRWTTGPPCCVRCWPRARRHPMSPWWTYGCRRRSPTRVSRPRSGPAANGRDCPSSSSPSTSNSSTPTNCWPAAKVPSDTC